MQALRSWSFTRVVLTSAAWISAGVLLGLGFGVGWFYFQLRSSEGAGAGAVAIGVSELTIIVILAILVVPPVVLIAGWLITRRR